MATDDPPLQLAGTQAAEDDVSLAWRSRLRDSNNRSAAAGSPVNIASSVRPIDGPFAMDLSDPRWLLACRTAEQLEGATLRPQRREQLIRLAKIMGLTAFSAQLIIAAIQDQARRGVPQSQCAAASVHSLMMVPTSSPPRARRWATVSLLTFVLLAVELTLGAILLGHLWA